VQILLISSSVHMTGLLAQIIQFYRLSSCFLSDMIDKLNELN